MPSDVIDDSRRRLLKMAATGALLAPFAHLAENQRTLEATRKKEVR